MGNWDQFVTQFSQFVTKALSELSKLVDQIFVSGILGNLFAILKAIARFIVAALETIVRLLKFIVK
jgi:phage-related protein